MKDTLEAGFELMSDVGLCMVWTYCFIPRTWSRL